MSDNLPLTPGAGANVACDELTYSGDTAKIQLFRLVHITGAEGSKVLHEVFGYSNYHVVSAATDNAANIKSAAGQVYTISAFNNAAAPRYVKLHNTSVTPTAGAGVVYTVGIQAGAERTITFPHGFAFTLGIGVTIVAGIADSNTGVVAASDVVVDVSYK